MNIVEWLESAGIKNYTVKKDMTVDVYGDVDISRMELEYIPVQFGVISGTFDCSNNKIKNLSGAPNTVGKSFFCSHNEIISLSLGPKLVGVAYDCGCNNLLNLVGLPQKLEALSVRDNPLKTFEGIEIEIKMHLCITDILLKEMDFIPVDCKRIILDIGFENSENGIIDFDYIKKRFIERDKIKKEQQLLVANIMMGKRLGKNLKL